MRPWNRWFALTLVAAASVWWLSGCSGKKGSSSAAPPKDGKDHKDHKDGKDHSAAGHKDGHKEGHADHKEAGHGHAKDAHKDGHHHDKALTEKDVKMPDSFKAGVARLEELHKHINHQIEHGELPKVHRTAEEMALVAKKMKELARKDIAEDHLVEAGQLLNEVAGYFKPIDEAADAGKKAETEAIHKKMGETIAKVKALAK